MSKIIADISDELVRDFKKRIIDDKGKLRGEISKAVEEAIKLWLRENK